MMVGQNLVGLLTGNKVDDIIAAEVLLDGQDRVQYNHKLLLSLYLRLRMQTVVAVAAVVLIVLLTEIVQQHLSATDRCLGIGGCLHQQLSTDILFCHRLTLHKLLQFIKVLTRVEGQADTLTAITTSTTRLLIVAFQRLRDVVVDHKADIGFINTHTEGDGSHNHVDVLHQEVILRLGASGRVKTGMISCCLDIVGTQDGSQLLYLLTGETVNDTTLARVLFDEFDNILVHILRLGAYLVIKVRTIEGTLELSSINNSQVLLDVGTHLVGSRRREGDNRCRSYLVHNGTDTTVLWTEVMSPFRDTMGLIDSIEGDLHGLQELHIVLLRQRLRGDIQQFGMSCQDILLYLIDSRLVQR